MNEIEKAIQLLTDGYKRMAPSAQQQARFGIGWSIDRLDQLSKEADSHVQIVVFCSECENRAQCPDGSLWCTMTESPVGADDYCSQGVRHETD